MKEELRPCVVKIGEETQTIQFVNSEPITRILKEGEVHKGYFHMWYKEERTEQSAYTLMDGGIKTQLLAVVEFEDGTVHMVEPECISFTDRT